MRREDVYAIEQRHISKQLLHHLFDPFLHIRLVVEAPFAVLHFAPQIGPSVEPEPRGVCRLFTGAVEVVQPVGQPIENIGIDCGGLARLQAANPSALHKWWAQRPLAAARAVIFSQLVHDPEDLWRCQNPEQIPSSQVKGHWTKARAKLFEIIEELVVWENTTNEAVLERARQEIRKSWRDSCELNKHHPHAKELFDPEKLPAYLIRSRAEERFPSKHSDSVSKRMPAI